MSMKKKTLITVVVIVALLIVGGIVIWEMKDRGENNTDTANNKVAKETTEDILEKREELIDSNLYSPRASINYDGNYLPYDGLTAVADDFKQVFDDAENWQVLNKNAYPQVTGEQLGNWIDFDSAEAMSIDIVPYENGTVVRISLGSLGDENQYDYDYFTDKDLFDKVVAVKNKYNTDTVTEMMKADPNFTEIYGVACRKDTKDIRFSYANLDDVSELTTLTNLEGISFDDCTISDATKLGELKKLKGLSVNGSAIPDYSFLNGMTNLEHLSFERSTIPDTSKIKEIKALKSLRVLDSDIQDYAFLSKSTQLETLVIEYKFYDPPHSVTIPNLSASKNLIDLTLYALPLSDINFLKGVTGLEHVYLKNMPISDVSSLKDATKTIYLDLTNTDVSDVSVAVNMPDLEALVIPGTKVTDVSCLKPLKKVKYLTTPFPYNDQIAELQRAWDDHEVQFKYHE